MSALARLLDPEARPVQLWACGPEDFGRFLDEAARTPDLRLLRLDGATLPSAPALFRVLAAGLAFPAAFGHNWDALDECLHDLEWIGESSLLLAFDGAERLLAEDDEGLALLLGILGSAAEELQEPEMGQVCLRRAPITLRALLHTSEEGARSLDARLGRVLARFDAAP